MRVLTWCITPLLLLLRKRPPASQQYLVYTHCGCAATRPIDVLDSRQRLTAAMPRVRVPRLIDMGDCLAWARQGRAEILERQGRLLPQFNLHRWGGVSQSATASVTDARADAPRSLWRDELNRVCAWGDRCPTHAQVCQLLAVEGAAASSSCHMSSCSTSCEAGRLEWLR
jgi:hypothetical protein